MQNEEENIKDNNEEIEQGKENKEKTKKNFFKKIKGQNKN